MGKGMGAQAHLPVHTAPELWFLFLRSACLTLNCLRRGTGWERDTRWWGEAGWWRGEGGMGLGGRWVGVGVGRELYLTLHCHQLNDFCFKMGNDKGRFNV